MADPAWRIGSDPKPVQLVSDGSTEATGDGWNGRFERATFGPGFHMNLGRVTISADCEVPVTGDGSGLISAYAPLAGFAQLSMEGVADLHLAPGRAILFTAFQAKGLFRFRAPQVFRFFSVALSPELLISLLDGHPPTSLAPLVESCGRATVVRERAITRATRDLIAGLGRPGGAGALHRLHREAVAIRLLTELVEAEFDDAQGPTLAPTEEAAVLASRERLLADLRAPPPASVLAASAGLGVRRFLIAFERLHGASPTQLVRLERLARARALLETGELAMKEIAWEVGYRHVSNFVAAFAEHYGRPPRQFMREC